MTDPRRTLPSVDRLLLEPEIRELLHTVPRAAVVDAVRESLAAALAAEADARRALEHAAGMTAEEARAELLRGIEEDARKEGARIARRIEDESRERLVTLTVEHMDGLRVDRVALQVLAGHQEGEA